MKQVYRGESEAMKENSKKSMVVKVGFPGSVSVGAGDLDPHLQELNQVDMHRGDLEAKEETLKN